MIKLIGLLSKQKLLNIVISIAFYLLVTLPHEFIGVSITAIFKGVSRQNYDRTILSISFCLFIGLVWLLFRQVKRLKNKVIPGLYFMLCLALMIISLNLLIIVNIEIIHFIQYFILAILLFPLCRNFLATLSLVTLLGVIDEAYQYYYLSPERTNYFDFNDVILNLLGGAMGLIFLRCHIGLKDFLKEDAKKIHLYIWVLYGSIITIFTVFISQKELVQKFLNRIRLIADWENFGSVLIRKPTTGFWTVIHPNITYHVVQPIEGIIIVSLLLYAFGFLYLKAE